MTVAVVAMSETGDVSPTRARLRRYCIQAVVVLLINVPTVSSGLSLGWVSLASGESGEGDGSEVVVAAATTFLASLLGVPLSAWALTAGRKVAVIGTSIAFLVCWSLTLCGGGWWVVCARAAAGLGGAGAWAVAPLLAQEMCEEGVRGAAVAALVFAHNLGFLLMYVAAAAGLQHSTVVWWCAGLSAAHCAVFLLVPESPAYLAANGRIYEARWSLAWLRGSSSDSSHDSSRDSSRDSATLDAELAALPLPDMTHQSPIKLVKDMLFDRCRRRAFFIAAVAVIGQEMCGILTLLQFAERVFVLARDGGVGSGTGAGGALASTAGRTQMSGGNPTVGVGGLASTARLVLAEGDTVVRSAGVGEGLASPAGHAVLLGAVQLVASVFALYLVEKVGRRRLVVWAAVATGVALAMGAGAAWCGAGGGWVAAALALAVAADSAGLQPAPYALLADLFHYQYRGCALSLVTAGACIANAVEVLCFAWVTARGGLAPALCVAAGLTLALAGFAAGWVPETRGRALETVYRELCADRPCDTHTDRTKSNKHTVCTKM